MHILLFNKINMQKLQTQVCRCDCLWDVSVCSCVYVCVEACVMCVCASHRVSGLAVEPRSCTHLPAGAGGPPGPNSSHSPRLAMRRAGDRSRFLYLPRSLEVPVFGVWCSVCGVWAQGQARMASWIGRITGARCPGWAPRMSMGHSSLVAEDEVATGGQALATLGMAPG